eukprot:c6304_g1_i1.p1 GENE.c6304_g1_i1~~c6304_g1_i1.p1  ORF type:complete len:622 (-),score=93.62 c6304_g1_i1:73-1938(-)
MGNHFSPRQKQQHIIDQPTRGWSLSNFDTQNFYNLTSNVADLPDERLTTLFEQHADTTTGELSLPKFIDLCKEAKMGFSEAEITRVYEQIKPLRADRFLLAIRRWKFLSSIISSYNSDIKFIVPSTFDPTITTNANYKNPDITDFEPAYARFRALIDYNYHVNYTRERQVWQDAVVRSVVRRTQPQPRPWLILTCGLPGAGKTFALSWMSENGFFPLENVVRVDPDQFKFIMPEWELYLQVSEASAARKCHHESGFLAELAQHAAMSQNQHVWVDTTLKDHQWFASKFEEFRVTCPLYRIAIFHIVAPRDQIQERLKEREERTGRRVPPEVFDESMKEIANSLEVLTSKVNFVARINNGLVPTLEAVQVIDSSGSWSIIQDNFARVLPTASEFPQSLAPLFLTRTPLSSAHISVHSHTPRRANLSDILWDSEISQVMTQLRTLKPDIASRELCLSPDHPVNLDAAAKKLALIPERARFFRFVYPLLSVADNPYLQQAVTSSLDKLHDPVLHLFLYGGFAYLDDENHLLSVNSVTTHASQNILQFGPRRMLPVAAKVQLQRDKRWKPVTLQFIKAAGAVEFAWILPQERFGHDVISKFGAFAYHFTDGKCICFPVASTNWEY